MNGNRIELQATVPGDALDPFSHDRQGVFRQIDEYRAGLGNLVTIQTSRPRRDAQRHIQRQPRLGTLRRASDDPHCSGSPKLIDQPALGVLLGDDVSNANHG
jgi:hypothetical protein